MYSKELQIYSRLLAQALSLLSEPSFLELLTADIPVSPQLPQVSHLASPPPARANTAIPRSIHQYLDNYISVLFSNIPECNESKTYFCKNVFSTSSSFTLPSGLSTIGLFNTGLGASDFFTISNVGVRRVFP